MIKDFSNALQKKKKTEFLMKTQELKNVNFEFDDNFGENIASIKRNIRILATRSKKFHATKGLGIFQICLNELMCY